MKYTAFCYYFTYVLEIELSGDLLKELMQPSLLDLLPIH